MKYTIAEAADKSHLSAYTIRFYDKKGLLPFVERNCSGSRIFNEIDIEWLKIISCLKETGMPLKEIKGYIELFMKGDATLEERSNIIKAHKKHVEQQISALRESMKLIDHKVWYYETAISVGTEEYLKSDLIAALEYLEEKKDSQ